MTPSDTRGTPRPLHLALQGGGAHGALTWGVLDRLLEDGGFDIAAVSGTSAGAMNAVALADGLARGGAEGAREALASFWDAVGEAARVSPMRRSMREQLGRSPGYQALQNLARLAPQGLVNPLGLDPLRTILAERIDFEAIAAGPVRVHVAATDARTGRPRVFSGDEVGIEAVVASACLPQLSPAVEIDGAAYWDGGYSGNPALLPLVEDPDCTDIVLVSLNPDSRELPRTAADTLDRTAEFAFGAPLLAELRMLDWAGRNGARVPRIHRISGVESGRPAGDRLDADPEHLRTLFAAGRLWAGDWLAGPADTVGGARAATGGVRYRVAGPRRRSARPVRKRRPRVPSHAS